MKKKFKRMYPIEDVLQWTISGDMTISQYLTDAAEDELAEEIDGFVHMEALDTKVEIEGKNFVVTFIVDEKPGITEFMTLEQQQEAIDLLTWVNRCATVNGPAGIKLKSIREITQEQISDFVDRMASEKDFDQRMRTGRVRLWTEAGSNE